MLPPSDLTKSQVDRLGDRLRKGDIGEDDLRLLDSYRRSFGDSYEEAVSQIRDRLNLEPTGRPAKSTTSIIEKLQRESIRLSQMQDIAGCRLTVDDIAAQDEVVTQLGKLFDRLTVVDRRDRPSHGYRAVHVVVEHFGKLIEVQVRTLLQHLWAELSEKLSDVVDKSIKYGGGPDAVAVSLAEMSETLTRLEAYEGEFQTFLVRRREIQREIEKGLSSDRLSQLTVEADSQIENARRVMTDERRNVIDAMKKTITQIRKEGTNDLLN